MKDHTIDGLFEKLSNGDLAGAEKLFLECETYLRKLARRRLSPRLRSKLDSTDVAHSVWADLFRGFRQQRWNFADAKRLRAFLVTAIANRVNDRYRQYHYSVQRDQPLSSTATPVAESHEPTPSKFAEADDLWEQMLELSPPEHHELLWLKRQGYSLVEIAARTGLHEGSVRRILRHLARKLAVRSAPSTGRED